jgi:cyclic beta-1,2-glucan synthetase
MSKAQAPTVIATTVEEPIRAELFSVERLEQHAESLAAAQEVVDAESSPGRPLLPHVIDNGRRLLEYYRATAHAVELEQAITPAAEWLLDNFYIVEEQLREIRDDLPVGFYRKLPKLISGHLEGYPRVYGVAWAYVAHTDSRLDPEVLRRFVMAYQRVQPLTIGELWAVAIILRVVLVENLRRIAERIVRSRNARLQADVLADRALGTGGQPAVSPDDVLRSFGNAPLDRAFAVRLIQRLRDLDPKVGPILTWLDERLTAQGTTSDEIVRAEHQEQAALTVTVRNIITSMRLTSEFDWHTFFESISLVDAALRDGSNFEEMDFATRDYYRHAIEDLARGSNHSEIEIAQRAVQRAKRAHGEASGKRQANGNRRADPGYYLLSHGRAEFEKELGFKIRWRRGLLRSYVRHAVPGYLGTIAVLTGIILALPLHHAGTLGLGARYLFLMALLAAIPASDLAIALINRTVTDLLGPRTLPRLELRDGVPEYLRTMVVVPTLLTSQDATRQNVDHLEIHFLANPDGDLRFALLTDWTDSTTETADGDDELLDTAITAIAALNRRHGPALGGGTRFFLFHRKRQWNEHEAKWMGWERKRGKLQEFNHLLRGATNTSFLEIPGQDLHSIQDIRYVVTLDADTRLPRATVSRLVGTMAHALNRPEFDSELGRVVDGYAIVQPRVTPSLPTSHEGSLFQKIFSGPSGIDPYAAAVSDVYQDLFREGSFTGKGIYDVDAFEMAIAGKADENTLLSHDLFEGVFARAALASDIELFDEFPSHYEASALRQHRWARGDWQLLPWILGLGRSSKDQRGRISIPAISRWKMIDNLRRTLSAPAMFLTMVVGWMLPHVSPWMWTRFVLAMISIPPLIPFLVGLHPRFGGISKRSYVRNVLSDLSLGVSQIGLTLTFVAYQAWLMGDAILRTMVRLLFTHKNMLQWVTAAQARNAVDLKLAGIYKRMSGGLALALAALLAVRFVRPPAVEAALPFVLLWIAAPMVARWISLPPPAQDVEPLSSSDIRALRSISRRTWRFFEKFVTDADHWLPPDNFQEEPKPVVAHRTSPTNIGLNLLANLSARDLGWIGTEEAVERLEATCHTLGQLELYRGHFYNWYETAGLQPLEPKYVSSVDSGNLAGHLLVVGRACHDFAESASVEPALFAGIDDAIHLLRDSLAAITDARRTHTVTRKQLSNSLDALAAILDPLPVGARDWARRFVDLRERAQTVADVAQTLAHELVEHPDSELRAWAEAARACIDSHVRDARILLPMLRLDDKYVRAIAESAPGTFPEWDAIEPYFHSLPTIANAPECFESAVRDLSALHSRISTETSGSREVLARIELWKAALESAANDASALSRRLLAIAHTAENLFSAMDFRFLYDEPRKLFAIGFRPGEGTLDTSCYDLLASEARLTSFIAIAKGEVPSSHWFRLGRALTPVARGAALLSWSGSMFEYLMPALVMRSPEESMLSQTYEQVVFRQIEYGGERGVPWGISESAFNVRDIDFTYQYSSFGVPGLGLKRGLSEDLVIAPYATALAAMIKPSLAVQNLARIAQAGGRGVYGFYESLDYTKTRVPEGKDVAVIHAYMAHHQGMSLVAFADVLTDGAMKTRFHSEPIVQATELLLQERTPRDVLVARPRAEEVSAASRIREMVAPVVRKFSLPTEPTPRTHLLSNGRYAVMLTSAGSGYSRWRDVAITRWREDSTRDCWGQYIFLRDEQTGNVWSAGYQPTTVEPDGYEAIFFEDHAEIIRRDRSLTTQLDVVVSSEDDTEVRRLSITNLGVRARDIQVTSYAELSLTTQAADVSHPAFAKLFVETEFVTEVAALLATRRKRSNDEASVWVAHVMSTDGETVGDLQYETDRARFVGRTRSLKNPVSVMDGRPLSNTVGPVLDPIISLRRTVHVPPGTTVRLIFSTIAAETREQAIDLADKYRDSRAFERTITLAWTQAQVQLNHLGITSEEAIVFQRLANDVLYVDSSLRPSSDVLSRTPLDISSLWSQGISGDLPIILARVDDSDDVGMIRQLLRAHEYWRMKQLSADVVIINEKATSYIQDLQDSLEALVRGSQLRLSPDVGGASGKIFLMRGDIVSSQIRTQIQSVARAVLLSRRGTLAEQVTRSQQSEPIASAPARVVRPPQQNEVGLPHESLKFFNGLGGFAQEGREYVTVLGEGARTPEPWVNVIANPNFGFLVSESGSGFTWSVNSQENQLTPWSNDHIFDTPGEVLYIRDEATGEVWTPTALPIRDDSATYIARHGQGYSVFQHASHGVSLELLQFVPPEDSIKISRLTLRNDSGRARRLSVTSYVEWVLGSSRATAPYLITEMDSESKALLARSAWSNEFGGRVAFAAFLGQQASYTGDRTEFLGRNGSAESPAALHRNGSLSGKVGAGLDPCGALQTVVELKPGAQVEIVFFLGQSENVDRARDLLRRYRKENLNAVLEEVKRRWDDTLGNVQVSTPDPTMDLLLNRWLLYQTLSCRVWARAGFYQVSGAYGFRDQLQDVMALSVARRGIAREQILLSAAHQFTQGDVQHWWHPPSGRGIRTRMSDDLLWLPYVVNQFVESTGDMTVLEEQVAFLEGDELAEGQLESYFQPRVSESKATIFEHCARAIDRSLSVGSHGLPLMGTGDWNDGMNRVGQGGKGESVWLGWFLHTVMWEFAKFADARGEHQRAENWRIHVSGLKAALEKDGWDGEWYRRAYFDDGTPLGSSTNDECKIDAIAQSWGVISGAAERGRSVRAMAAVDQLLVRRPEGVILLLTPPFDHTPHDPGYIKGYLPGIRENGGQYTHASTWTMIAFAALGDGDKASEMFRFLNPINRTNSRVRVQRYKAEPYVIAGDVYAENPHLGRAGWTWYSGSAGWMYRGGIEWILGLRIRGMVLSIDPCIPRNWPSYTMEFRYHSSTYKIKVENPSSVSKGVALTELDGRILAGAANIPLVEDGKVHQIRVVLG